MSKFRDTKSVGLTGVDLSLLDDNGRAVDLKDDVVDELGVVGVRGELVVGEDVGVEKHGWRLKRGLQNGREGSRQAPR